MATSVDMNLVDQLGLSQKAQAKAKSGVGKGTDMGEDAFLKLVLAQLKNQDPLKPMENGAFLSQLAQIKSVTGIEDMKNSFEKIATQMQSSQALQASSLVGRWVMAPGESSYLLDNHPYVEGSAELATSSQNVSVYIHTADGQLQRKIDLGPQKAGKVDYIWDGSDGNGTPLPAGKYSIKVTADIEGKQVSLKNFIANPVESVTLNKAGGGITLNVSGIGKVSMSDVEKIM
jgi:flagellar basal-body rod modification protein FlgD